MDKNEVGLRQMCIESVSIDDTSPRLAQRQATKGFRSDKMIQLTPLVFEIG